MIIPVWSNSRVDRSARFSVDVNLECCARARSRERYADDGSAMVVVPEFVVATMSRARHMRLSFKYSCDEWIELRRVAGTRQLLGQCIYVAEGSLLPLMCLFGASGVVLLLRYLGALPFSVGEWPAVVAFTALVCIATFSIYLSYFRHLRKKVLIENWETHGSSLNYSIEFNDDGVYLTPDRAPQEAEPRLAWSDISSVVQTKRFYMLRRRDDSIYIPKSVFGGEDDRDAFLKLLYRKTVEERAAANA